ncbi:beta-ketoacyl synthase N-terminal-like domain-containing protein [Kitasatospora cineracea]|uniref:type I polyketide synthase n=1 Tax=Kitasatospora cineracea TaxID=88074 RepID=UPI0033D8264D
MSEHTVRTEEAGDFEIAVVGLAARMPGAATAAEFWNLLAEGREAARTISDEEFLAAGGDPADLDDPSLVRRVSMVDGFDRFDAEFFGFSPADAELLDPQQRLLLESAYHALEDAGYPMLPEEQVVGVYAGADDSHYYPAHVHPLFAGRPSSIEATHAAISNSLGSLATRISYELGLTGPSMTVQTTCSTGLVAIHTACQELLGLRCDLAVAAAASINPAGLLGYRYVPDGPFSPDGRVRAFDADARGTADGSGVGVVVLKRLADALADGDRIRAVIKGSAVNNDGRRKVGFTAPSVEGQLEVILEAQAVAGVDADSIGYVEAHGTGTAIGDPIEVAALTGAFRESTDRRQYCALGSAKTNIGHLGAAAGMAGFIKTVLALEHRAIPPNLHFERPNPLIDFAASPFRVPTSLEPWERDGGPRRAAVSAFGVGGTNAHVVLEEAPEPPRPEAPEPPRPGTGAEDGHWRVLPLSARTPGALRRIGEQLADRLARDPAVALGDVAHTLRAHRPQLPYRAAVVASRTEDAARLLAGPLPSSDRVQPGRVPPVAFLLPGGGTQYVGMGADLYRDVPVYRAAIDACAGILRPHLGHDLRDDLYRHTEPGSAEAFLSLVATQYALARTLTAHGVQPDAFLGHSLGEYTAACLAGVLSLEEMLPLVATRLRLIIAAGGATTSVALGEPELRGYLTEELSLAAVNGPHACTVAGRTAAVAELEAKLTADAVTYRRLRMPAAAHSLVLDPVLESFATALDGVTLHRPHTPYVTNVTGDWITDDQAVDRRHWIAHTRRTVRFADGVARLWQRDAPLLVEVGPGQVLGTLAQTVLDDPAAVAVTTMRHARAERPDGQVLAETLGRLWSAGVPVDLAGWEGGGRRVSLPAYPFERRRHWIPAARAAAAPTATTRPTADRPDRPDEPDQPGRPLPGRTPRPLLAAAYLAPRTDLERAVTAHWEEVLKVAGIGIEDNFFDLGGDSMRAVLLTSRLRGAGVLDVPVTRLLAAPTVRALAAQARPADPDGAFAPVLALRADGSRRPLFCVHPSIGTAWCYTALLPRLGPDQPVYGLQARGLDGREPVAEDAAAMVADCLARVRAVQPHGPYRLLGGSYGGVVAHAVATELRRGGEQVELLAMMDTPLPETLAALAVPGQEEAERLVAAILGGDGSGLPVGAEEARAMARVFANNLAVSGGFALREFDGELLFFTAAGPGAVPEGLPESARAADAQPLAEAWRRYAPAAVRDHRLPCGHYEMTRPEHIARVGEVLATALARLDGPHRPDAPHHSDDRDSSDRKD